TQPMMPSQSNTRPNNTGRCFYCGEVGHMQDECEERKTHEKHKLIIMKAPSEGRGFKLPSGEMLPRLPSGVVKTIKQHVEEYYAEKGVDVTKIHMLELYDFLGDDYGPLPNQTFIQLIG